ncbi:Flp pilus assembly protein CpaB [Georgenia wangjunii]|uniref:Flp pilus assembly protein CpaB n=1 Tax=Georgenia wangjunii TaxID=3117730 RepID=UPI002F269CB7
MNRRLIAGVVAVVLAGVGAVLVFSYVSGADQRAMAGMEPASVLVVTEPIPEGTPAEMLAELVAAEELPASAVAAGAVSSLDELGGLVVTTDLQPGEQLLASRFTDPESLTPSSEVDVPDGMHQVSVLLDSQRMLGGHVAPGETVGVFVSMTDPIETNLVQHKVLVTRVQGGITPVPAESQDDTEGPVAAPMPEGSVMVTLAVDAPDAEQIVFGAEHGTVWLSLEDAEAPETGTRIVTRENVYE